MVMGFSLEPNSLCRKIIVSNHAPHPIYWSSKGIKGTHQNLWKDIMKELPSFVHLVHCVVGEGRDVYF